MRAHVTAVVAALVGLGVACGDGGAATVPTAGGDALTVVAIEVDRASSTEQVAQVARARLDALGLEGEIGWDDGRVEVFVEPAHAELVRATLRRGGQLELRPVLSLHASEADARAALDTQQGSAVLRNDASGTSYVLGPAALGAGAVEGVTVAPGPDDDVWLLDPVLVEGPDGIDAFNEVAEQCHAGTERCPSSASGPGQIAIVVDDVVLSAPGVQTPVFDRDGIRISGGMGEIEARSLAAAIAAGTSTATWTVRG